MTEPGASLREVLEAAAKTLDAIDESRGTDRTEWSIGGRLFAVAAAESAEFRLDPAVASAALRTPDTEPSARGRDWVTFRPTVLDRHAIDRATAWLGSAWRRADGES